MESIHAKVNGLASIFCTMKGDALVHQVLRSLSAQADHKLRKHEMTEIAKEIKVVQGEMAAKDKNKRRQGTGKQKDHIDDKFLALIPKAKKPLLEGWFVGMPPSSFK
jgi:hypothetical protein